MDEKTIEPWQAARVYSSVYPLINYLYRLQERMVKAGFPPDDKLLSLVSKAYDAMHRLYNELHYLACGSGVGRPSRESGENEEASAK